MPADDNQDQTQKNASPTLEEEIRSGPLPGTEDKAEGDTQPVAEDVQRAPDGGISMISGIGAEEPSTVDHLTDRPELKEPGLPPMPEKDEETPPPPEPGDLNEPRLEVDKAKDGDLGVKDISMQVKGAGGDVGGVELKIKPKGKRRTGLIAGALALLLLAGAGIATVLFLPQFRGDIRQRAAYQPPTGRGGACNLGTCTFSSQCDRTARCYQGSCVFCNDKDCASRQCTLPAGIANNDDNQDGYIDNKLMIGGLPEQGQINFYYSCSKGPNPCAPDTGSDAWCSCDGNNGGHVIGCIGAQAGTSATFNPSENPRFGQSLGCAAICGDGKLQPGGEECDDGNRNNGDGCDANCHIETGPTPTPAPVCGNNTCETGETCENGALRPGYSGTGDPGSFQCLSTDVGKYPSGPATSGCRFPGSPFGAPYCAQVPAGPTPTPTKTPTPTPSPTRTPTPTPTPVPMCVNVKAWVNDPGKGCLPQVGATPGCIAGDWREIVPINLTEAERAALLQVGNTIRFTVRGANATFTRARFSINGAAPVETTTKYGADFYVDYQLTQSGPVRVKGELFK